MKAAEIYDHDYYAWAVKNAQLMRQGKISEIDSEHIAEELESMGNCNRRELLSRLAVLFTHLLKWQFQPVRRDNSWKITLLNQRDDIEDLLEQSPSLLNEIESKIGKAYSRARRDASIETGMAESAFPEGCPFTIKQALDRGFWPE